MNPVFASRHRWGLGLLLVGNLVAFAGVDPPTRLVTAALALALAVDLPATAEMPKAHRIAAGILAGVILIQLAPLPHGARALFQPGLADLIGDGWRPLSVAPWATLETASLWVVALITALVASRMASTRSGLPTLLWILAVAGAVTALLGLASEAGGTEKVLLIRENTGGGGPYGPFVNSNHFAVAMELTLPAAAVLLAAAARRWSESLEGRRQAALAMIGTSAILCVGTAALLRSGSRGGVLIPTLAVLLSLPLWRRHRPGRRWGALVVAGLLLVGATSLAWTRLPELREGLSRLLVIEGVEDQGRWALWEGTARLWTRAPVLGVGMGAYRHVAGIDAPPTGTSELRDAHNDWLEWCATTGLIGAAALTVALAWLVGALWPSRVRRQPYWRRYALAGAAIVLLAVGMHEVIGFGLQTPANGYLLAAWVGLAWSLGRTSKRVRRRSENETDTKEPTE